MNVIYLFVLPCSQNESDFVPIIANRITKYK